MEQLIPKIDRAKIFCQEQGLTVEEHDGEYYLTAKEFAWLTRQSDANIYKLSRVGNRVGILKTKKFGAALLVNLSELYEYTFTTLTGMYRFTPEGRRVELNS